MATSTAPKRKWASAAAPPFPTDAEAPDAGTAAEAPDASGPAQAPYIPNFADEDAILNIDFGAIPDSNRGGGENDVIAPGYWLAFIRKCDSHVSGSGGKSLKVVCTVYDGPEEGKSKATYVPLTANAVWKLKQLLSAIAVPVEEMGKLSITAIKERALNTMIAIQVEATTWNTTDQEGNPVQRPSCNISRMDLPTNFGVPPGSKADDTSPS